jgi:dipeptidyl aminopeptidase/acylaminoacyl peptidase
MVPHLFAVELAGGRVTDLLPGSTRYMDLDGPEGTWDLAPDGGEIAFSANDTPSPHRTLDWDVFLVSTAGGAPRSITDDNPGDDLRPRYTPDGRSILYGRTRRPELEADFTRLARYDRKTGDVVLLTETWDAQPAAWTVTPDGRSVLLHAVRRGRMHLWALGMDGGEPRLVARGGTTSGAAAGPAGAVYFARDAITRPAELMTLQLDGKGEPRALTSFNDALIEQLDLGTVRDVTFLGAGGDSVQMFVVLPPDATPGRPAPLVQVIHGGPHGAWLDQFHYRWNAALFASRGFVAALVNFHGSTGSGQAFCESIVGAHGDKPFTDIMASTDWLIAAGLVDSTRMVAAGGSYGGYLVNWILGHTTRYRALVSHAGVYDLMAQFASDATWGRSLGYGAAPWEDPSRIDRWSPNRFAANFATPTLVLHGEKDYRVPVTQGIELYGVLTAKGVPARLVVFPEENHWVQKPQASRLWWNEVFAWMEAHVGGAGGGPSAATR